jgi:DNA-binding CsgD family transcriptional regulator
MKELVFELRLSGAHLPKPILDHSQVLHLLRFDTDGYLMICKMPRRIWEDRKGEFPTGGPRRLVAKVIGDSSGDDVLLQVSGLWISEHERQSPEQSRSFEFFKSLERLPVYQLKPPTIEGNSIRIFAVGESSDLRKLLKGLEEVGQPFKVIKLDHYAARGDSPLLSLTLQQSRVLRLAQTLGYYDVPRRKSTQDLARILGMDKGTVGDHLRRAEKHVFDSLLRS